MNPWDIVGAVGAALLLLAYLLVGKGILDRRARSFHALNLVGAFLLVLYSAAHVGDTVFIVINSVWAMEASFRLAREET